jgi:hypothetical protein
MRPTGKIISSRLITGDSDAAPGGRPLAMGRLDGLPAGRPSWQLRIVCALPIAHRSGSRAAVAGVGVEEPRSGRLATADADLPSLSYGHLVGDSTGPTSRASRICVGSHPRRPALLGVLFILARLIICRRSRL